jgi:hypothetical protein
MKKFGRRNESKSRLYAEVDQIKEKYLIENQEDFLKYSTVPENHSNINLDCSQNLKIFCGFQKERDSNTSNSNFNIENTKPKKKIYRLSELEQNNIYAVLNINENASAETIKTAYKNQIKLSHPDKGGNADVFRHIQQAYQILSHDVCRKIYDKFSKKGLPLIDFILRDEKLSTNDLAANIDYDVINYYIALSNN